MPDTTLKRERRLLSNLLSFTLILSAMLQQLHNILVLLKNLRKMRDLNSYSKLLSLFQLRTDPHLATWELAVKYDFVLLKEYLKDFPWF